MADSLTPGSNDIIQGTTLTFSVGVPDAALSQWVSYLRLGRADNTDEGALQEDPAATQASAALISSSETISPFSDGGLVYTTGHAQFVAPYSYIRLGRPTAYETWLPVSTTQVSKTHAPEAFAPAAGSTSLQANGLLLYSNDTVQVFAPKIKQMTSDFSAWSGERMSVVGDSTGLMTASRTWGTAAWPATVEFQRANTMNSTLGSVTNMITGNTMSSYLGNYATSSSGSKLTAHYGVNQNVTGGHIVNIVNDAVTVQGFGQTAIGKAFNQVVSGQVRIAVNPAAGVSPAAKVAAKVAIVSGLLSALSQAGLNLASNVGTSVDGAASAQDVNQMKSVLAKGFEEVLAASSAVLVMQAMALVAGIWAAATAEAEFLTAGSSIWATNQAIRIKVGGTRMAITSAGISANTPTINNNAVEILFG